jgi:plastocyanin
MAFRAVWAASLPLLLTACTSTPAVNRTPKEGTGTASGSPVQDITVLTGRDYRFHPSTIVVRPGQVRVRLVNTGKRGAAAPHDWSLLCCPSAFVPLTRAGETETVTFTAPQPGRYRFVCTIHVRQGQTGTMVVRNGG